MRIMKNEINNASLLRFLQPFRIFNNYLIRIIAIIVIQHE